MRSFPIHILTERGSPFTRGSLMIAIALLLSCSPGSGPKKSLDRYEGDLLRVEGMTEKELEEHFRGEGTEVSVLDLGEEDESFLLIEEGGADSLSRTAFQKLRKEASLKKVEPSSADLPEQEGIPSDITDGKPHSGMDLPDIFDIFTRIY